MVQGVPADGTQLESNKKNLNKNKKRDSAPSRSFSLLSSKIHHFEELRSAPWNAETILALSSAVLPIPDLEEIRASGDEDALEQWWADWGKPAERLYAATITLEPRWACQRIDALTRYMVTPGSPSWWQQGRDKQTPTMLRHVADHFIDYSAEMTRRHKWSPPETTPYDGPGYESGYGGHAPAASQVVEEPPEDAIEVTAGQGVEAARITRKLKPDQAEIEASQEANEEMRADQAITAVAPPVIAPPTPAQPLRGMTEDEAQSLAAQRSAQHPSIQSEAKPFDDGSYALRIFDTPTTSFTLRSANDWRCPPPVTQRRIQCAIDYGASLVRNDHSNEIAAHSPPPAPVIEAQPLRRLRGMSSEEVEELAAHIAAQYPSAIIDFHPIGDGRYVLGLVCDAAGQCVGIRRIDDWLRPSPKLQQIIDQAIAYGEAMARLAGEGSAGGEDET